MRISELSRTAGVPLATVKFYLREGLLPPGRRLAATQADYDQSHVERLRLVRALIDVGRLPLGAVRSVLEALDAPGGTAAAVAAAHAALPPAPPPAVPDAPPRRALDLVDRLGWHVHPQTPALRQLEQALDAIAEVGVDPGTERLVRYARQVGRVAEREVAAIPGDRAGPEQAVRHVVLGTVLFEPVLLALRRLAQQHHFTTRPRADDRGPGR